MVVADLHIHTRQSDGTLTLDQVPAAATEAEVDAVAITDHDRVHPGLSDPIIELDGITVIRGIELRVQTETERLDLLGYGVSLTDELETLTTHLQQNRKERARAIVSRVEEQTGVELDLEITDGVGRPHIARAIEDTPAPYNYQDAFAELIGNGCPCYVSRDIPSFRDGFDVLRESSAVISLAHPFRYDNPTRALERATVLDAIEIPYPYGSEVDISSATDVVAKHDLLVTGGSDAHDETVGSAGLDERQYDAFRSALSA